MKNLYIIILIALCSCKSMLTEEKLEICNINSFKQKINEVLFNDVQAIKKLNGQFVKLEGIFHAYFEDVGLYPSTNSRSTEAMWLNLKIPKAVTDSQLN